jgi:hypothetical protein
MMTLARISGYVTSVATALAAAAIANAATGPVCAPCVQASMQHIVQRISDQRCTQLALHTGQAVAISADIDQCLTCVPRNCSSAGARFAAAPAAAALLLLCCCTRRANLAIYRPA